MVRFSVDLHEDAQQYRVTDVRKVAPDEDMGQEDLDTLTNRLAASQQARHEKRSQSLPAQNEMYFHRQDYLRGNPLAREEYFKKTGTLVYKNRFED